MRPDLFVSGSSCAVQEEQESLNFSWCQWLILCGQFLLSGFSKQKASVVVAQDSQGSHSEQEQ